MILFKFQIIKKLWSLYTPVTNINSILYCFKFRIALCEPALEGKHTYHINFRINKKVNFIAVGVCLHKHVSDNKCSFNNKV